MRVRVAGKAIAREGVIVAVSKSEMKVTLNRENGMPLRTPGT